MRHDGLNIVAIGGGTGLSTLLRGLKAYVHADGPWSVSSLAAVVTVTDEGGSSGVLRKEFGMLPPGDIRNCIVALAEEEQLLSRLFKYRFDTDSALKGHSLGNLLLTALTEITGGFDEAVLAAQEVLAIRGKIIPSTLDDVRIRATLEDGTVIVGEVAISGSQIGEKPRMAPHHARIVQLDLDPADARPPARALEALAAADLIIIGPGSLYTSVLPNLVIRDIAAAIREARALRVYICNVMTQPGETDGYSAQDHLKAIADHAGLVVDVMVINGRRPSEAILRTYEEQNQHPVQFDTHSVRELGVTPFFGDIIAEGDFVRHDSTALADTIFRLYDRYGRTLERMRKTTQA
ncbi:MAG TPA: uridine diphosphate-N-acetylglucosamine-binding protein YvcK [Thermoanaerobaculia bacterium]|nr:uridine diphosphate-N-acetylglucosamine-binding protein YvcK [Thermoanaerobaculia bacterium]